ncbi:hypothetical protein NUW54_g13671 [Trametes sanguinea]|uniref:Uncharacterized protein n=1 Tax=Trametes sanguinea TaxID=158606 RepID=A0ACC1MJU3_9APHY|nr:hypothetical protein NUW54_g13671 [Trametes sanguinea]
MEEGMEADVTAPQLRDDTRLTAWEVLEELEDLLARRRGIHVARYALSLFRCLPAVRPDPCELLLVGSLECRLALREMAEALQGRRKVSLITHRRVLSFHVCAFVARNAFVPRDPYHSNDKRAPLGLEVPETLVEEFNELLPWAG